MNHQIPTLDTPTLVSSPAPDLTRRAPRSPRVRLGGYALLPRLLDKCRASLAGTIGEYHTNCPLDHHFLSFVGLEYDPLRADLAQGRTDGEILQWITTHAQTPRSPWEIANWSAYQEARLPGSDAETAKFFATLLGKLSQTRADIHTWVELLDLDDHVSFGGTA